MLAVLGSAGMLVALIGAGLLVFRGVATARTERPANLEGAARLFLAGAVAAMVSLLLALVTDDFSIVYTANHHSTATPFPFDVATAWAALEGSIVLWGIVLAGYTWFVYRRYRRSPDRLGAAALAVMGGVGVFFFGLMLTVANPFETCVQAVEFGCAGSSPWPFAAADAPANGPGPNPLLQNHFMMAIHPPVLYLGYVGMTVPFAYAIGALALGVPGPEWLRRSHRSTLVAWSFLSLGILLGGWWAYEVLSWGGYWAWDPVENASLMPWLVATAFLHSGIVQQRRGMLQAWNFILVISTFALTILGTFLTRSGTINSVHSFTQSAIGPALLGFLVLVLVGSFTLFSTRADLVASSPRLESFVSREGTFLVNNLLLSIYAVVVLVGTTYPLVLEAFTGTQVGVGEPFFNRLAVPLSFLLLLVMGFGPITPWRTADPGLIWRRTRGPALVAVSVGLATALLVTRNGWIVLSIVLGLFVTGTIVGLAFEQARNRSARTGGTVPTSLRQVVSGDGTFWAGQLSHIGVVLVAVGMAFAANLGAHTTVQMSPGESTLFEGHAITYESPFQQSSPAKTVVGARFTVTDGDSLTGVVEPSINLFGSEQSAVGTPDVLHGPAGDLYVTLEDFPDDTGAVDVSLDTSPMIWVLWLGGLVVATGGLLAFMARRRERRTAEERATVDV
ncbi:MAG TPA: cytochrome c-type biogenesis CcmF C-terminal domain-containing protein [Acidimicrobiia bacterium]|nr:cytochrome c-type biogenesis CcmF C-terminal domain-containing protein [Acidimicrobiia bacterium]